MLLYLVGIRIEIDHLLVIKGDLYLIGTVLPMRSKNHRLHVNTGVSEIDISLFIGIRLNFATPPVMARNILEWDVKRQRKKQTELVAFWHVKLYFC